jgi:hypothetical protein
MREVDGRQGFWRYAKLPTKPYGWYKNLVLSPLFGYIGTLDKPPIKELEPIFVDISEVQIENGFKRLINDEWYQSELKRLEELMI